jgi:SPP1 gp7 family putative phage head morphogenesis protein
VLKRLQEAIATLPEGGDWREIRQTLAAEISPYMDDSPEGRAAAADRAELLLRVHGMQAYAAARYQTQVETADALPYWQYQSVGDQHVRDSHAALDGKVLPAADPFWTDHYPPWDYGCRCVVRAITQGEAGRMRAADAEKPAVERRVLEGEALEAARSGTVAMRNKFGQVMQVDVMPPAARSMSEKDRLASYRFRPGDLHPDLDQLRERYDAPTFAAFEKAMRAEKLAGEDRSIWDWLVEGQRAVRDSGQ